MAIENKDYASAIPPLSRVLKANPGDWNALRNRAIAYLQMGSLSKAKEDYSLLVRLMPRYYVAYYGLGEIAYREKDTETAIRNYERYLKNFPPGSTPELDREKQQVNDRLQELKTARR
jgi:tetratricopeptide (TPR) repeat protein